MKKYDDPLNSDTMLKDVVCVLLALSLVCSSVSSFRWHRKYEESEEASREAAGAFESEKEGYLSRIESQSAMLESLRREISWYQDRFGQYVGG